jgi:hypothetical protein
MLGQGSTKAILAWLGGLLVVAGICLVISFFVVDRFLAAHNPPAHGTRAKGGR